MVQVERNIPACAGKTHPDLGLCSQIQEHPRVRGENPGDDLGPLHRIGTSPRARGKRSPTMGYPCRRRNIPACAGKTETLPAHSRHSQEHPRVRGENSCTLFACHRSIGTSPRARGKLYISLV